MDAPEYRFRFTDAAPMADVEETLVMAVIAAEGLHGRARVRLDARFSANPAERTCTINADNEVGQDIARIFTELLILEIGTAEFEVSGQRAACRGHCATVSGRGSR